MNEEERAVEYLKEQRFYAHKFDNRQIISITTIALNLIKKQQKRISELEEIEKEHKKINGELRKEIEELNKDISNMYHEQVIRNILEDECGLSKYEIDEILN